MRSVTPSSRHRVTSQLITAATTAATRNATSSQPDPLVAERVMATATATASTPRPDRTTGDSGCSRCQAPAGSLVTGPLPWPRPGRPAGRAAAPPPPAPAPGCGRRWPPPPCAAARGEPEDPVNRAGGHVDELHAAVG